jgi:hypothetical protein
VATGPILQNSGSGGIPSLASFLVDGTVKTSDAPNTIRSLDFAPGSLLEVYQSPRYRMERLR